MKTRVTVQVVRPKTKVQSPKTVSPDARQFRGGKKEGLQNPEIENAR